MVRILMRAENLDETTSTSECGRTIRTTVRVVPSASAGDQYKKIPRRVWFSERTGVFSVFTQFVHRAMGCAVPVHRLSESSFDGTETDWSSLFQRRCCHGFDSTAGTPILAARRALGRTNQG